MWPVVFYFLLLSCALAEQRVALLVETAQGPVRGYKDENYDIFGFYNIPYATAPTGSQRFKAPLPPPNWSDPFEADDKGIICPQVNFTGRLPKVHLMLEDCLIANIYVPTNLVKNLPVLVYIHSGAFVTGYGNFLTPKEMVSSGKIIAVTFNYRLGAHGFLCLGTEDIPGNAGIKDQVALLRWVKKNIINFGGNPDDVTINGYRSGSSSADLLVISKMARGLFKKVIPESGASTAAFSVQVDPLKNAKEYASMLNFDKNDDIDALEKFYKLVSIDILNSGDVMQRFDSTFLFSPCIERGHIEESFLEDTPTNILKSGNFEKFPMLYGYTNMEGLFRVPMFDKWKNLMNEKFSNFLPADLEFESDQEQAELAQKIKELYFGVNSITEDKILAYVEYFTDVFFAYPILRSVKLQVEAGNKNIFLYKYSFTDENTPFIPYTRVHGANHISQSSALLDVNQNFPHELPTKASENMTKIMRKIWINFITTGKPVLENSDLPTWPPVGAHWSPYMSLSQTVELKGSLLKERAIFWQEIYDKHYRAPIPPPPPKE